jgi:hypothetical protein
MAAVTLYTSTLAAAICPHHICLQSHTFICSRYTRVAKAQHMELQCRWPRSDSFKMLLLNALLQHLIAGLVQCRRSIYSYTSWQLHAPAPRATTQHSPAVAIQLAASCICDDESELLSLKCLWSAWVQRFCIWEAEGYYVNCSQRS